MSENKYYEKLKKNLKEMFQMDRNDLDFGIYRIMNQKSAEIEDFLENKLLTQVKEDLEKTKSKTGKEELEKAIKDAESLGIDPNTNEKIIALKEKYDSLADINKVQSEIFSHLNNFFACYYSEGDFMSHRRYKPGKYAIPYEGEEVKLHWANSDQYYIKSSEDLKDYTFIASGKRVHFKLINASTEKDNVKEASDKKRMFVLCEDEPFIFENDELFIRFEYKAPESEKKQENLNKDAVSVLLNSADLGEWRNILSEPRPTDKNKERTLLEKHLNDYTAKHKFDYFIHKDLGGFLRRELDFYIKNEIMHLDDIENESAAKVEEYLDKIKVIRKIAGKIIDFLEQLENFQKKIWLKKKFVVETNWCITLDRIPESFYEEIAENDKQIEEWVDLFSIDKIELSTESPAFEKPLPVEFLKANEFLVLDTKFFSEDFKNRLLETFDDIDEQTDGLLIHSENFQALQLLQERYKEQVKCIYIDPPYNTGGDGFLYKDSYKHSSWYSMIKDRLKISGHLMSNTASIYTQIDYYETHRLREILDTLFFFQREIIWDIQVLSGFKTIAPNWVRGHETIYFHTKTEDYFFKKLKQPHTKEYEAMFNKLDTDGRKFMIAHGLKRYWDEVKDRGKPFGDVWNDIMSFQQQPTASERIGFSTQKPEKLLERIILSSTKKGEIVIDFFAGSGTTSVTACKLSRYFINIEVGSYFYSFMLPRMKKTLNGFTTSSSKVYNYKGGGIFKYIRLESYEDALDNLTPVRTEEQNNAFEQMSDTAKEEYILKYMLDVETKDNESMLNVKTFTKPFDYKINIRVDDELVPTKVNLVETFNYLIGLKVENFRSNYSGYEGLKTVEGRNLKDEKIIIIWRDIELIDNNKLDEWFKKQQFSAKEQEYDYFYVNGDNNIENWRKDNETWKVRLIDHEFPKLMFDVKDVM
ncbi:DNA methyltransferase [Limisalsivibrio acetivorans]|uniref:DNA methyltransferase n=1 Tax=Limisalsivibrio acetivorans TaxID=1304888 RepID=UPI0003B4E44F|nr:DNA methyltransferase [Limisalsivibrio acetivorans]